MKRVVTGWDESGKPAILFEGEPPTVMDFGPIVTDGTVGHRRHATRPEDAHRHLDRHVGSAAARRRPGVPHRDVPPAVRLRIRTPADGPDFLEAHATDTIDLDRRHLRRDHDGLRGPRDHSAAGRLGRAAGHTARLGQQGHRPLRRRGRAREHAGLKPRAPRVQVGRTAPASDRLGQAFTVNDCVRAAFELSPANTSMSPGSTTNFPRLS